MGNNLNLPGTLEFAVRHAIQELGADRLAKELETALGRPVSVDLLYKATNPNNGGKWKLPDMPFSLIVAWSKALKTKRHRGRGKPPSRTEHFSDVLRMAGLGRRRQIEDMNAAMSATTCDIGRLAGVILEVTSDKSPGGRKLTREEMIRLREAAGQALSSVQELLAIAEYEVMSEDEGEVPKSR